MQSGHQTNNCVILFQARKDLVIGWVDKTICTMLVFTFLSQNL